MLKFCLRVGVSMADWIRVGVPAVGSTTLELIGLIRARVESEAEAGAPKLLVNMLREVELTPTN